eukprot:IDg9t1
MHKSVKELDKKSMAVYVTAGYRILQDLPEPVQHTLRQKQATGEINYMSEVGEKVVEEILEVIAKESQVIVFTRLAKAYSIIGSTKRASNQDLLEYAEIFKGLAFKYLTMTHASDSSVTSEQLAHLMISNSNLAADMQASALMRLSSVVSEKGLRAKSVKPASELIESIAKTENGGKVL